MVRWLLLALHWRWILRGLRRSRKGSISLRGMTSARLFQENLMAIRAEEHRQIRVVGSLIAQRLSWAAAEGALLTPNEARATLNLPPLVPAGWVTRARRKFIRRIKRKYRIR